MNPEKCTIRFKVSMAWWLLPYLHVLTFFCRLHNVMPNPDKVVPIITKAVKIKVITAL